MSLPIRGKKRVELDKMWRDPKTRKLFEKECKIDCLALDPEGAEIDYMSGHLRDYGEKFVQWALERMGK